MKRTGKPRRTKSSTIAGVASVEPESTTTISAQSPRLSRHLPMQSASLRQITAALRASATPGAGGSERCSGDSVAGSVSAISLSASRGSRTETELQRSDSEASWGLRRYLVQLFEAGKFHGPLDPILARLGPRHHIAAMIDTSPPPILVLALDSDSPAQGLGAPSAPNDAALFDDYSRV